MPMSILNLFIRDFSVEDYELKNCTLDYEMGALYKPEYPN